VLVQVPEILLQEQELVQAFLLEQELQELVQE
jgi:hypothetical protein